MTSRWTQVRRWLVRPVARPILARIDSHIQPLQHEVDALARQVRFLADTVSAQAQTMRETRAALEEELRRDRARLADELGSLRDRFEFTRNEFMYELRYGGRGPGGIAQDAVLEPRIVSMDRLAERDEIRLNLGCGHLPLAGFLNVDSRELDGVDVVADVHRLPFGHGSVAQIHSAHLLEHFPIEELRRSLLPYWTSLLRSGGRFTAIVPDSETMMAEFAAGRMSFEEVRLVTYGQQEYDKDFHFNMFSQSSLRQLFEEAGLTDVRIVAAGRRNGVCYEMEIEARRAENSSSASSAADASSTGADS